MNNTNNQPPKKIRIKKGTALEIKSLYKAIKDKKRANGIPYTQQSFVIDLYLNNRSTFQYWTGEPQQVVPSKQTIALMNILAEQEGI